MVITKRNESSAVRWFRYSSIAEAKDHVDALTLEEIAYLQECGLGKVRARMLEVELRKRSRIEKPANDRQARFGCYTCESFTPAARAGIGGGATGFYGRCSRRA